MRVVFSVLGGAVVLAGCGPDLGNCDMTAATQVVYTAAEGTPFYQGQALIQQSCAGGNCHAASAVGINRIGAPHGLNFDAEPLVAQSTPDKVNELRNGLTKIRDVADTMWGQIEGGSMPPG